MVVADAIYERVQKLPQPLQAEVLDFVEFLLLRAERDTGAEDEQTWATLSLDLAMRGMEDEETPGYTLADLKERFA
ncbi:MAG TPA: DUF2281 domain-containing protein [Anaerolineae bacterium]|nr:DUF2281 domain-containing protein [Anaerolineae bacterium]